MNHLRKVLIIFRVLQKRKIELRKRKKPKFVQLINDRAKIWIKIYMTLKFNFQNCYV